MRRGGVWKPRVIRADETVNGTEFWEEKWGECPPNLSAWQLWATSGSLVREVFAERTGGQKPDREVLQSHGETSSERTLVALSRGPVIRRRRNEAEAGSGSCAGLCPRGPEPAQLREVRGTRLSHTLRGDQRVPLSHLRFLFSLEVKGSSSSSEVILLGEVVWVSPEMSLC